MQQKGDRAEYPGYSRSQCGSRIPFRLKRVCLEEIHDRPSVISHVDRTATVSDADILARCCYLGVSSPNPEHARKERGDDRSGVDQKFKQSHVFLPIREAAGSLPVFDKLIELINSSTKIGFALFFAAAV